MYITYSLYTFMVIVGMFYWLYLLVNIHAMELLTIFLVGKSPHTSAMKRLEKKIQSWVVFGVATTVYMHPLVNYHDIEIDHL